jgi:hypothetical protein
MAGSDGCGFTSSRPLKGWFLRRVLQWLTTFVLLTALAACGGGGGGSSPTTVTDSGGAPGTINPGSNTGTEPTPGGPVASDQGVEFRVNTTTALSQNTPDAARLPDGGYVVAWTSRSLPPYSFDDPRNGIYAQRYGADGAPVGGETRLDTYVERWHPGSPQVTALADGGYLVAWVAFEPLSGSRAAQLRRVRPDGSLGSAWQGQDEMPFDVLGLADGGYVVLVGVGQPGEAETALFIQRFSADDVELGRQPVSRTTSTQAPSMAALQDGTFLVVWGGWTTTSGEIYTQRFNADGSPAGVQAVAANGGFPGVAALKAGGYVLSWTISEESPGGSQYNGSYYLMTQAFRADGSAIGSATRVDPAVDVPGRACPPPPRPAAPAPPCGPFPLQVDASLAGLEDGGYVVTWYTPDREGGVHARRFDAQGSSVGNVTRATSTTPFLKDAPVAVGLGNGGFVIAWESTNEDGDLDGVYARQWGPTGLR